MADRPKPGSIVHVEFHAKDPKKLEKFYGSLFGWKFQEVPGMN
jgi:predicted enzyme related to lactoylglutathione lyase